MHVLYATDGSTPAREAQRLMTALFDPGKCQIHVFSVEPELTYPLALPDGNYELEHMDVPPIDADGVAREGAEHLLKEGFIVSSSSARGNPAEEILGALADHRYDLIVLGASHTSWMGNTLLGSVSTHVLHHSPCSVLVTHRAPTDKHRVLVGLDGSDSATAALHIATKVLKASSAITIATVVHHHRSSVGVYPPGPPFGNFTEHRSAESRLVERAWQLVERPRASLQASGFAVDESVLLGRAGPQLLKEADNIGADLVVVGSRGLGPLRRAALGSVSDQIVRHAPATLIARESK